MEVYEYMQDSRGRPGSFRGGPRRGGQGSFRRGPRREGSEERGEQKMYDAVCAECKQACQVPFQPSGDRPVYCKACFDKKRAAQRRY